MEVHGEMLSAVDPCRHGGFSLSAWRVLLEHGVSSRRKDADVFVFPRGRWQKANLPEQVLPTWFGETALGPLAYLGCGVWLMHWMSYSTERLRGRPFLVSLGAFLGDLPVQMGKLPSQRRILKPFCFPAPCIRASDSKCLGPKEELNRAANSAKHEGLGIDPEVADGDGAKDEQDASLRFAGWPRSCGPVERAEFCCFAGCFAFGPHRLLLGRQRAGGESEREREREREREG